MIIRQITCLQPEVLIRLALVISKARLLAGWNLNRPAAQWWTLAINESQNINSSLAELQTSLVHRSVISHEFGETNVPPFTTGFLGHLSYEYSEVLETSIHLPGSKDSVPLAKFSLYEATVSTNMLSGKTFIYATNQASADGLERVLKKELSKTSLKPKSEQFGHTVKSDVTNTTFESQVKTIQQRILAGDFFQANLTRVLHVELGDIKRDQLTGFAERLLTQSQAPFGAILNFDDAVAFSVSPERFFRIEPSETDRKIFAEPIKGTRPRHSDPKRDEALKQDLLASEKDRAENIMIADLVRNDLSRVCLDDSIVADPICEPRSFKNVHHLVTRISGILRDEVSNLDALLAQFPCGSITGAPKWAAMDTIAEIEQRGRGIYCGAIGYFDDRGHADFSVAIRTAVASFSESGTTLQYGTGGGITILSDPKEEFQETEDKAAGFLRALYA